MLHSIPFQQTFSKVSKRAMYSGQPSFQNQYGISVNDIHRNTYPLTKGCCVTILISLSNQDTFNLGQFLSNPGPKSELHSGFFFPVLFNQHLQYW